MKEGDDQNSSLDNNNLKDRRHLEKRKLPSPVQPSLLYMTASLPQPLQSVCFPKLKQLPVDARLKDILYTVSPRLSEQHKEPSQAILTRDQLQKNRRQQRSIPLLLEDRNMMEEKKKNNTENGRRYHCSICQKRFMRPSSLKIHIYSHTGEKPYQCTFLGCERRFSVHSNMKRHLQVHL